MGNSALHRKIQGKGKFDQTQKVSKYYEHDCGFPLGYVWSDRISDFFSQPKRKKTIQRFNKK